MDLCCSRFVRSSVEEDEEDCDETQPSKQHAVNGNGTNGLLEEGSPSECTNTHIHTDMLQLNPLPADLVKCHTLVVPRSVCYLSHLSALEYCPFSQVRWRQTSRTMSPVRTRSCPLKMTTASPRTLWAEITSWRTVWSVHRTPPKASKRLGTTERDFLHSSSTTWEKQTSPSSRRTQGRSALTRDTSGLVVGTWKKRGINEDVSLNSNSQTPR